MISFQAPDLCQFEDEELLRAIGELAYPGLVQRHAGENGLRLWVEGSEPSDEARETARFRFRVLLGAIRAWRISAGELAVERLDGLGPAAARDDKGNQWVAAGPALIYDLTDDPHLTFGRDFARAIKGSVDLTNAFWLFGRTSRNATDFYMIHEYAKREFGGTKGIQAVLDLSVRTQNRLTQSANNLSPLRGGRHANNDGAAPWSIAEQGSCVADLLQRWVFRAARDEAPKDWPYALQRDSRPPVDAPRGQRRGT